MPTDYNFHQWEGKPFQSRARGPHSFDCWGLIAAVLQDAKGIRLPAFLDDEEPLDPEAHAHLERWRLIETTQIDPFDIVYYRMMHNVPHLALAVSPTEILHTTLGERSRVESVHSTWWGCKLEAIYRYGRIAQD